MRWSVAPTITSLPELSAGEIPLTTENQTRATTPYERLGGQVVLRALVDRFYDLMEQDPAYAALRAMHAPDLAPMRDSLTGFLTGWSGGPRDWFGAGKCVMGAHRPLAITAETTAQWLDAMGRAVDAVLGARDPELAAALIDALRQMATAMGPRTPA
ncbi:MAG TPA: group II truncated hemoglobin [Novosphingobium sp.]